MEETNNSGVNTMLIVLVLVVLVGLGVWWVVSTRGSVPQTNTNDDGININVDLPLDDNRGDNNGDTNGSGSGVNDGSGTL